MPHTPFRYVLNSLLYILITGCRWCDLPQGNIWASKSSATNSVRPILKVWTNQRFVLAKTAARAGARPESLILGATKLLDGTLKVDTRA